MKRTARGAPGSTPDRVLERLYNFDAAGALETAEHAAVHHPPSLEARTALTASLYFAEMVRTGVLALTLFDIEKAEPEKPDRDARDRMKREFDATLAAAAAHPTDRFALFAQMYLHGLERDFLALVHKSYLDSWRHAQTAQHIALRMLEHDETLGDAWFTLGFNSYIRFRVPALFRGFTPLEFGEDDRDEAIKNIEYAAEEGRYLKGFAMLVLAGVYRAEGRRDEFAATIRRLRATYPDNAAWRSVKL